MTQASTLEERWAIVRGEPMFYRVAEAPPAAPVILHVHGFAISGRYMLPTAELLADDFGTYVPDLPGFGKSLDPEHTLTIDEMADSLAAFLDVVGVERASVLGNSLGCAIVGAFAYRHPDRIDRAILVSPAGGRHSQPLLRAVYQLALDAPREPMSMARVAVPDYLRFGALDAFRLFREMIRFPALERLLQLSLPTLAVLGARDPLLPPWRRIRQVADQLAPSATVVLVKEAAHAMNFSHPVELAAVVRQFMDGAPITGPEPGPGISRVVVVRRPGER